MTEIKIPEVIGGGNYTLALHAQLVLNEQQAEAALADARKLLTDAESVALATRKFNPQEYQGVTPPQTVLMGDKALTINFSPGRGGGWSYTISEVAA